MLKEKAEVLAKLYRKALVLSSFKFNLGSLTMGSNRVKQARAVTNLKLLEDEKQKQKLFDEILDDIYSHNDKHKAVILQFPSVKIDGTEQLKGNRGKVSIPDHDIYQKVISDIETQEKDIEFVFTSNQVEQEMVRKQSIRVLCQVRKNIIVFFTDFLKRKFKTDDLNIPNKREKREYREQLTSINDFFELQEKATTSKPDTDFIERHYISPYISPEYKKYLCIYATSQLFSYKNYQKF